MSREKGSQTKEKLIATAAKLFLERGYNATGINEILETAGVPKGSFYFHFHSKKELASFVAEYYANWLENWLQNAALGKGWPEFVHYIIQEITKAAELGMYKGCPLGVLGVEIAFSEPELAEKYGVGMDNIIRIFSDVLKNSGLSDEVAALSARRAFAVYEGYIQYYRITRRNKVFDYLLEDLLRLYK